MTSAPPWKARVFYTARRPPIPRALTRTGKDGTYVSEPVPPGIYVVRVEGRDMLPVESSVTVVAGARGHGRFQAGMDQSGPGAAGE